MLTVAEAQAQILANIAPLDAEWVPTETGALGRVLAQPITAPLDLPPFANSSMDGYAVIAADLAGARAERPVPLRLIGEVPAGGVFAGAVRAGTTARIFTGAPLPAGADAVLQQELTAPGEVADIVMMQAPVAVGNNVRAAGSDIARGAEILPKGVTLHAAEIAAIAACGLAQIAVTRRPQVAIVATGDELIPLGRPLAPGQIYNSNTAMLAAAITEAGGEAVILPPARDDADAIRARFAEARRYDLAISSGGVSVGDYDLVKTLLAELGQIGFWRVNVRPGKPLAFGHLGQTPFIGLPGNPVSSAVTFELFARPLIRALLGCRDIFRPAITVALGTAIPRGDRQHYVRVALTYRDGQAIAQPTGDQGSHRIASMLGADALAIIDAGAGIAQAGEVVPALLLR